MLDTVSVPVVESPGSMPVRVISADAGLTPIATVPTTNALPALAALSVKRASV